MNGALTPPPKSLRHPPLWKNASEAEAEATARGQVHNTPMKGNTVNTIKPISTATDTIELQGGYAEVRALHAVESRPMEADDPRLEVLRELYFSMSGKVTYSDCSLPRPA